MTDEDSELGDFEPQNDSSTEGQNSSAIPDDVAQMAAEDGDGGLGMEPDPVPDTLASRRLEASDHDRQIRPGDVVRDLWGGGWQIVFQKKADTVAEYDRQQPDTKKSLLEYEGNKAMGATEEDTVWQLFYVNKNNTLAGGRSGPYSFPESRICRYAYESTDGWKRGRFQDHIQMQVLEQVADAVLRSGNDELRGQVEDLLADAFDPEESQEAFELAEASGGDQA